MHKLSRRQRQWVWFVTLWCAGLMAVAALSYAIKGLMFMQL